MYGWIYRVYPEQWQVILQTKSENSNQMIVENTVVYTSDERPDYNTAVGKLLAVGRTKA